MAKLVILNQGMTGRTFDLSVECTTVGRVEDNTFQIADASVSSHHAEIVLRGPDIVIKDLNSTNGSFINGDKITEAVLQPGQTLRFGQVELKIDDGKELPAPAAPAPIPPPTSTPAPASAKKQVDATMIITRGVSLNDLEQSGVRPSGFDTNAAFSKKTNKVNKYFLIIGIVVGVVILGLIILAVMQAGGAK
jgi:pSer/pThr/pTyr-binding forkhead associated (FHA) protein